MQINQALKQDNEIGITNPNQPIINRIQDLEMLIVALYKSREEQEYEIHTLKTIIGVKDISNGTIK